MTHQTDPSLQAKAIVPIAGEHALNDQTAIHWQCPGIAAGESMAFNARRGFIEGDLIELEHPDCLPAGLFT
jgi:hypothetical protein